MDVEHLKSAAAGRWRDVLATVGGIDAALLDGRHHPCPRCGGSDRFRLLNESTGACLCNQCFSTRNGDGISAVQWLTGKTFPQAMHAIADHLGLRNGHANGNGQAIDIVTEIARRKRVPIDAWRAFGAHTAERGKLTVCRLPMYAPDGAKCSYFDMSTANNKWLKGLAAAGQPTGVFLADGKLPEPGQTVLIAEGCKDAAALHALGYVAVGLPTCKLSAKFARLFRGCHCTIVPDRDVGGTEGAQVTAARLAGAAASVRIATLPGELKASGGADVRDVLAKPEGEALVRQSIADAQEWKPKPDPQSDVHQREPGDDPETLDYEPTLIALHRVTPKPVEWLWPARMAIGKLNLIAGDPGLSKSILTLDAAARVTTGRAWPDGAENVAGGVVLMSAEDDIEDTIVPRLVAAGADLSRINALQSVTMNDPERHEQYQRSVRLQDLQAIEKAILRTPGCRLVIADPISAYTGDADSHKNADIRGLLAPLCQLAAQHRVAIVAVTHLNKAAGANALYRATGSLAFVAAARSVWLVARDRDDQSGMRRLLLPAKNNLGPDTAGLAYSLVADDLHGGQPVIAWEEGAVTLSADQALEPPKPERRTKIDAAADWLAERLAGGARVPSDELEREAVAAGFSAGTLKRCRKLLGALPTKDNDRWYVTLP